MAIEVQGAREQALQEAGQAMERLSAVANALGMKDTSAKLKRVQDQMASDTFNLIVLGRFKTGKSTLMNALMGRFTKPVPELGGKGAMATDPLPCTAILTSIHYSESPYVKVWKMDGKSETWSLERYLKDSRIRNKEKDTETFFSTIREFEIGLPVELCKQGITLWDSPGLDEHPQRDYVSKQAVEMCDAAIVNYVSTAAAGQNEREFSTNTVAASGTRVFSVLNLYTLLGHTQDQFAGYVWEKLITEGGGPPYDGQEPTSRDIYFVDSLQAEKGRFGSDEGAVEQSGLGILEKRLSDFLLRERHRVHLEKHIKGAEILTGPIEETIGKYRAALDTEQSKLKKAYEEIQPQLQSIRSRGDSLPALFERYKREMSQELKLSFQTMITQLRQELPGLLEAHELQSAKGIQGVLNSFRRKIVAEECSGVCNRIIEERVLAWSTNPPDKPGARAATEPIFERLREELGEEFSQIDRDYRDVHFKLTGWQPDQTQVNLNVSMTERVVSGVAGLVVGDFSAILGAGGGGFKSVGANFAGQLVAGTVLMLLGASTGVMIPVMAVVGIASGLVGGSIGLGAQAKKLTLAAVDPGLQKAPQDAAAQIEGAADEMFGEIEKGIMAAVQGVIEDEESNIRRIMELNERDQSAKAQEKIKLDGAAKNIAGQKQALKNVMLRVAQTME